MDRPAKVGIVSDLGLKLLFKVGLFRRQLTDPLLTLAGTVIHLTGLFTVNILCTHQEKTKHKSIHNKDAFPHYCYSI